MNYPMAVACFAFIGCARLLPIRAAANLAVIAAYSGKMIAGG
jgi:hypothetical protein